MGDVFAAVKGHTLSSLTGERLSNNKYVNSNVVSDQWVIL